MRASAVIPLPVVGRSAHLLFLAPLGKNRPWFAGTVPSPRRNLSATVDKSRRSEKQRESTIHSIQAYTVKRTPLFYFSRENNSNVYPRNNLEFLLENTFLAARSTFLTLTTQVRTTDGNNEYMNRKGEAFFELKLMCSYMNSMINESKKKYDSEY